MRALHYGLSVVLLTGCACGTDYVVYIQIVGSREAFDGRVIEVDGRVLDEAREWSGDEEQMATTITLCTSSRDRFLREPFEVTVNEGESVLSRTTLDRVACRLTTDEVGEEEFVQVFLDLDGTVVADWDDPRTETYCYQPGAGKECHGEPDF